MTKSREFCDDNFINLDDVYEVGKLIDPVKTRWVNKLRGDRQVKKTGPGSRKQKEPKKVADRKKQRKEKVNQEKNRL